MCGIFGSIALGAMTENHSRSKVADGVEVLAHRGPDGNGIQALGRSCFGHARLSIIDPAQGAQPMVSPDGAAMVTYNGEIYNFMAVRAELEASGHVFHTRSDTEVLLAAAQAWGADCLEKFRGMFAFAVHDSRRGTVMLARDRVGKKPLYYTVRDGMLWFSSELEALWRVLGPFRMDPEALDECLCWQYVPAPRTIYRDVFSLEPGHCLTLDLAAGTVPEPSRYWSLRFQPDPGPSPAEWQALVADKIAEAVRIRLVSDVPFGAFLSGGIDSTLVVAAMADHLETPVRTYCIGYREAVYSELEAAEEVARRIGTRHLGEVVEADCLALLPILVRHFGQPFADSSAVPTYLVSRLARRDVAMVLSGDGGDEAFAGYNTYPAILAGAGEYPGPGGPFQLARSRLRSLFVGRPDLAALQAASYQHFTVAERESLWRAPNRPMVRDRLDARRAMLTDSSAPLLSRLQQVDVESYLPGDILCKVDIAAMANSLEVRSPLLDHELLELAARIPATVQAGPGADGQWEGKRILRALAARRFPPAVASRRKQGFGLPLGAWMTSTLDDIRSRIVDSEALCRYFDRQALAGVVDRHRAGFDNSARLWNLLFLSEWMRTHSGAIE